MPSEPVSSMRPTKGEMKDAPALAASKAWLAEKQSVTLTMRFISVRMVRQAFNPSSVSGTLMQMFGAILASALASFIIWLYSVATTSAETGPLTIEQISFVTLVMLPPDFRIRDGLVVTPSSRPRSLSSRISLTSAVSAKNFMAVSLASLFARPDLSGRLSAFALAETRGKVTRHERRFAASTGQIALGAGAGADAGGPALHLCGPRRHGCRAGVYRARAARAARGGRHRLGQRGRSGRPEEAQSHLGGLRLSADR